MLFNLKEDPNELQNLAEDPQHAERVEKMMKLLATQQKVWNDSQPLIAASPKPARITDVSFFTNPKNRVKPKKNKKKPAAGAGAK